MSKKPFPVVPTGMGATRQVQADHPDMMVVEFCFEKGASGDAHAHPHLQSTYVAAGRFEFTVGDKTSILEPGDCLVIPSNTTHGCVALEAGALIDTFTPRRDDFL